MTDAHSFAASDGLRLAYYIDDYTDPWRQPETLLLLHAAMGSARRYFGWVPHLARHRRVVRLDLRGHGASLVPAADAPLTLERLVGDVEDLLDHLGVERAMKRVKHGRYVLIPAGPDTHGHFSHFYAKLWKPYLVEFMQTLGPVTAEAAK